MADDNGSNQIEFLLTQSQSIWSKTFLTYAELVKKRIFPEKETEKETILEESLETFCQEILTILRKSKNITLEKRNQYKKLVSTFIKINHYPLAGTFYYISDRYIPQNISDKIPNEILVEIINIKPQKIDSPPKNNNEHQATGLKDDEPQTNETRSKKPKNKPILYAQTQYQPIQHNPIQNKDNTQAFILFVLFLAGSILLKVWKSFILPPQILLLLVSIIYFILSVIVIHLTIDNFFNRKIHRFKQTNHIIGTSLAIFYICVFVSIVWEIDRIPKFINLFGKNNQTQLAGQDIRKSQNQNNVPGTNRNTSPNPNSSPSNNINCPEDALTNFQAFKDCTKNESDKSQLEEELKTEYVLSSPDNQIAGNLIKYYLNSRSEQEFKKRKDKIFNCQNSYSNPDQGDDNKKGDCIKNIIQKSTQQKTSSVNQSKQTP
jgi:hypothetical protein